MTDLTLLLLIWVFAVIGWRGGDLLKMRVCPICAGVSSTWIVLLIARWIGFTVDPIMIGTLMGGSIVGIAYTSEKHLPVGRSGAFWKIGMIPIGFLVVIGTLRDDALIAGGALAAFAVLAFCFFRSKALSAHSTTAQSIEKKLDNCC